MTSSFNSSSTKPIYRGIQIVWYVFSVIEILLLFRFILKLANANSSAGFSNIIYDITSVFVAPFTAVFRVGYEQSSIFEWTTILAMLVYWIIAFGIVKLLAIGKTVSTSEAAVKMNEGEK